MNNIANQVNSSNNNTFSALAHSSSYPVSVDSGATAHAFTTERTNVTASNTLVHTNLPFSNVKATNQGLTVLYPDGNMDQATHEATLDLPVLPLSARRVHLFRRLASGSLLSLGQLCDAGCTAYFDKTHVYMFYTGKIILQGHRGSDTNKLWKLDNNNSFPPNIHSLNSVIDNPTIAERIKFYHASLFSPTLDTLAKAIAAGYLTTFPAFTVKQLRNIPHIRKQQYLVI